MTCMVNSLCYVLVCYVMYELCAMSYMNYEVHRLIYIAILYGSAGLHIRGAVVDTDK
jgi:hypothetical protein